MPFFTLKRTSSGICFGFCYDGTEQLSRCRESPSCGSTRRAYVHILGASQQKPASRKREDNEVLVNLEMIHIFVGDQWLQVMATGLERPQFYSAHMRMLSLRLPESDKAL